MTLVSKYYGRKLEPTFCCLGETVAGTHSCLVHTMDASLWGGLNLKTVA